MSSYIFVTIKLWGINHMVNKVLTNLANNKKLAKGVIGGGIVLSALSDIIIFAGVYYLAIRKGVELRDEYYESEDES